MGEGQPRLLDHVRDRIRRKHYSIGTEETYVDWIRRFVLHHNKRHPIINPTVPLRCARIDSTSWRVRTTGRRSGRFADSMPSSHGSASLRTSL